MRRLLVFAYAFNRNSQVFSHQADIIEKLSQFFDQTIVVVADIGEVERGTYSSDFDSSDKIVVIEAIIDKSFSIQKNFETIFTCSWA